MTVEEAIDFLKNNAYKVPFKIKEINTYANKRQLVYIIDDVVKISFDLPMVCQPNKWYRLNNDKSNAYLGGYLHNINDIVKLRHDKTNLNNSAIEITDKYIEIINYIDSIPYNVSSITDTYALHLHYYRLMIKELRLLKQLMDENNTKASRWQYYNFRERIVLPKLTLLKAYNDMINIIKLYNVKEFYFTTTICFRGRIYTSGIISPTSDKLLRANLKPYNHNNDDIFINMDATASMLQILSVITCSVKLSELTNLTSNKPTDTWSYMFDELIINKTKDELSKILEAYTVNKDKTILIDDIYDTLNIIDRNIVKKTIMRVLYGSNPYQISNDFRSEYKIAKLSYKHITLIIASFKHHFPYESMALEIIGNGTALTMDGNAKRTSETIYITR